MNGMLVCKLIDTLMDPNVKQLPDHGESFPDRERYRRLVGRLNYLTTMGPNILFVVSFVNQFLNSAIAIEMVKLEFWDTLNDPLREA